MKLIQQTALVLESMKNKFVLSAVSFILLLSISACRQWTGERRVREAREARAEEIAESFKKAGVSYPPPRVLLRNFKIEKILELWALDPARGQYVLINTYDVLAVPGTLGPKRRRLDGQVPEGLYIIGRFNPASRWHLSLGLDYPNRLDIVSADPQNPGGDIFIHGGHGSDGCIPIGNDFIEELYLICLDSKTASGNPPLLHSFPCKMDTKGCAYERAKIEKIDPQAEKLWQGLGQVYSHFEKHRLPPEVEIGEDGLIIIQDPGGPN